MNGSCSAYRRLGRPGGEQRDLIIGGLTTRNYSRKLHARRLQRVELMQGRNYSC